MNFREMETFIQDIMSPDINYTGAIFKLLLSLTLGAVIGYERRRKGQFAGLRTFALIAMGATLAMLISIYLPQVYLGVKNGDPGRIAAQVVSGVGFLGAGAIIQMKGSVRGLTTAAGIWMTASIGLAVGAGMYLIAVVATLLIFIMLHYIERVEHHVQHLFPIGGAAQAFPDHHASQGSGLKYSTGDGPSGHFRCQRHLAGGNGL